jgi:hypothetical protein
MKRGASYSMILVYVNNRQSKERESARARERERERDSHFQEGEGGIKMAVSSCVMQGCHAVLVGAVYLGSVPH